MKFKGISKLITTGILLNSIPVNSFAGTLSDDTRYETFTEHIITINDVLEEDITDIQIKGRTEGLKSSFEDQLVTQEMIDNGLEKAENLGKYKVEIKTTGKNILPNDFLRETGSGPNNQDGKLYPSMFMETKNRYRSANLIKVKPNTSYTINCTDIFDFAIAEFDKEKKQVLDTGWILKGSNNVYTTSNKCDSLILVIRKPNSVANASEDIQLQELVDRIQLEEGVTPTAYESYKESVNAFYLNSPLLEGDTIEYINGKATHVHGNGKANPIYEPITADLSVRLSEGVTRILNNSDIQTNMEVVVDRTLNRAVEYTELAKTDSTIENLSKARYWSNLLKESARKDQLQNEINSITSVKDLDSGLKSKKITSNLDIYIKSENTLSISLDTNFITFENYSGVEDNIKEGAINIAINSSLPYSLNAYMVSEIQNSDKSSVMNPSILNIKDNSESNYQAFVDSTSKIVLKDNCIKGNNINHSIDLKLKGSLAHKADIYKTVIKFEVEQK